MGNDPSHDIPGARQAGFGMAVLMLEPDALETADLTGKNKPDLVIHRLSQLLDVFPARASSWDSPNSLMENGERSFSYSTGA